MAVSIFIRLGSLLTHFQHGYCHCLFGWHQRLHMKNDLEILYLSYSASWKTLCFPSHVFYLVNEVRDWDNNPALGEKYLTNKSLDSLFWWSLLFWYIYVFEFIYLFRWARLYNFDWKSKGRGFAYRFRLFLFLSLPLLSSLLIFCFTFAVR